MATSTKNSKAKSVFVVDNTAKFDKAIKELVGKSVYVGVPAVKAPRAGDTINNAALAYIHTNGSPAQGIPPRPFLEPGIQDVKEDLASIFRKMGKNALEGDASAVDKGMNAAGLIAQVAAKKRITGRIPPPLKPATLAARRARGRTGTVPLVDTGKLLDSIKYVIKK